MDVRAAVGSYDIFDSTLPALSVLEPGKLVHGSKIYRDAAADPERRSAACMPQNLQPFPNMCSAMKKRDI